MREEMKRSLAGVVEYMWSHLAEDVSLETLASIMQYDTTYFSAKFKKESGVSPMQYFAEMRAKRAANLMRETEQAMSEIAKSVRFSNIYYFGKFFEKHMGPQPEKYRDIFQAPPELPQMAVL